MAADTNVRVNMYLRFARHADSFGGPYYADSTYGTALDTAESDDGKIQTGCFDRRHSATRSSGTFGRQAGPWSTPAGSTYVSGQAAFTPSLSFDYANQTLPGSMTQGYDSSGYTNPSTLSYAPEVLSPAQEEQEEEEEEEDLPETKAEAPKEPPPKRKRGRPKLNRTEEESSRAAANSHRVPHNQVERKYRETLNTEMERLRVNVPTLPRSSGNSLVNPPKPSKATVLSAAVQYIKDLEHDVEALTNENKDLRSGSGGRPNGGSRSSRRSSGYTPN